MKHAPDLLNSAIVAYGNMFTRKCTAEMVRFHVINFFSNLFLHFNRTYIII